jgi:hypothetical protein
MLLVAPGANALVALLLLPALLPLAAVVLPVKFKMLMMLMSLTSTSSICANAPFSFRCFARLKVLVSSPDRASLASKYQPASCSAVKELQLDVSMVALACKHGHSMC